MIIPNNNKISTMNDNRDERSRCSTPNLLSAEMWLLQGGTPQPGNFVAASPTVVVSPSSFASKHPIQAPRGRSPNHRSMPTEERSSSSSIRRSTPKSPNPNKTKTATDPATMTTGPSQLAKDTPSSLPPIPSVCPIPSIYISHIRKAFGGVEDYHRHNNSSRHDRPIDLYTEVLGLPPQPHPYTDTQIRVAYFRQGRLVLQPPQSQSSSPNSTILLQDSDANTSLTLTSKQRFQAITKAYEIVTHPKYKAYYEKYGLPTMKPDAPTSVDRTPPHHSPSSPTSHKKLNTTCTPNVPSSRRMVDPIEVDRNDHCHTIPRTTQYDDVHDDDDCPGGTVPCTVIDLDEEEEDDMGSVGSIGSILRNRCNDDKSRRRSKSWGPTAASSSGPRVVWKEVVQELIYQPDPPSDHHHHHIREESMERLPLRRQDLRSQCRTKEKETCASNANGPSMGVDDRDFLDDFEASVDGIGTTIGNFVKFLSEKDVSHHSTVVTNDNKDDGSMCNSEQHTILQAKSMEESKTSSQQLNRQLFQDLTEPPTLFETEPVNVGSSPVTMPTGGGDGGGAYSKRIAEYHRRSHSCDFDPHNMRRRERCSKSITTAPLKEGKTDQTPRTKPKKSKRKKKLGVDKVPSNMTDTVHGTNSNYDAFDPFQLSMDASIDFGAVDPLTDAWKTPAGPNDCCVYDPITPTKKNTVYNNTKFDPYELPEVSSILASLDGATTQETPSLDLGAEKAMSFDDALDRTTDATTKGYIRLDRRAHSLSAVVEPRGHNLDVSDITFSSNVSDDPAGRHFHFAFLSSLTQSAKTTIKEIASFDEDKDDTAGSPVNQQSGTATASTTPNRSTPKSNVSSTQSTNDVDYFSQFNTFMQSLVEDMNNFGTQISTNFLETNRVVRDNMTFPETEVSGFLERIGTELHLTKSAATDPNTTDGD